DESQRPYFHYQNLYHDPKGVSEGLSIVPSPLANGSGNPLVTAYFQIEQQGRVTLPTLNEEMRELNAPNAAEQIAIRDSITRASEAMREAAAPLVEALARNRATTERIADLEARLAEATRPRAAAPAPAQVAAKKDAPTPKLQQLPSQQSQILDPSAFEQNARANVVYRDLKQRASSNLEPQQQQVVEPQPVAAPSPPTPNPSPLTPHPARPPRPMATATAAHELRTPLASLRLYSEMIADEKDPARRERYAREIAGQTERLGRLVANVLEVTRIERGTFALHAREGNIGSAVEACVEKLRPQMEAAGCPVELRVDGDLPPVVFDEDALHNIVDNLIDNAEKYSRDAPERNVAVDVAREKDGVSNTVRDPGPR